MPIYEYECARCQSEWSAIRLIAERHAEACAQCGDPAQLLISAPTVLAEPDYYDHGLGQRVTSRQQRRKAMQAQGLTETGTTTLHGAKGTIFSFPGQAASSVPKSGAYARSR